MKMHISVMDLRSLEKGVPPNAPLCHSMTNKGMTTMMLKKAWRMRL